jgi:hypothetical protein
MRVTRKRKMKTKKTKKTKKRRIMTKGGLGLCINLYLHYR